MENTESYKHSIRLLSRRDYSEYKLRQSLRKKNFPQDEIDQAIEDLKEQRYLREDLYIEARIKGLMRKYYSPSHIVNRLKEERISVDENYILDIFFENDFSVERQIEYLIEKKLRFGVNNLTSEKIIRFVMSKGHHYNEINKILSKTLAMQKLN